MLALEGCDQPQFAATGRIIPLMDNDVTAFRPLSRCMIIYITIQKCCNIPSEAHSLVAFSGFKFFLRTRAGLQSASFQGGY
ncbi:hypothetical protein HETIRDRAFT_170449 [Heterobasidion irregulare TC 32-1]|uniref:Uncharacterized protein n=1 Tax=Heterobasidion irregulare (strain TC 32-1) TaxID=747525 RepID=W4KFZ3_HETIT|nr:uncharacterized protein HETIRDRAFT_170449 [Heterobasidion irregulare TC 32-1]ETW83981.1 hypothetical protein HETIRDRAFT_170449 [Heterobasidion irregulare TC 32-1]